jgi:hypothetical protein
MTPAPALAVIVASTAVVFAGAAAGSESTTERPLRRVSGPNRLAVSPTAECSVSPEPVASNRTPTTSALTCAGRPDTRTTRCSLVATRPPATLVCPLRLPARPTLTVAPGTLPNVTTPLPTLLAWSITARTRAPRGTPTSGSAISALPPEWICGTRSRAIPVTSRRLDDGDPFAATARRGLGPA